jgi:hypothetical protein
LVVQERFSTSLTPAAIRYGHGFLIDSVSVVVVDILLHVKINLS